ncbi:hypothetical protein TNCV_2992841 [Trichonephila clavipes]|nr:hypothetical protein TNCV_2992841 [Trichonephila clavipes]
MKSLVYSSPVDSDETLVARIAVVAGKIREMSGVFATVRYSQRRRCEACIFAGGCFFEQFFFIPHFQSIFCLHWNLNYKAAHDHPIHLSESCCNKLTIPSGVRPFLPGIVSEIDITAIKAEVKDETKTKHQLTGLSDNRLRSLS